MDMASLREWLIANGIPSEELDRVEEAPILKDLGQTLLVTLQNDNQLGQLVLSLLMEVQQLKAQVEAMQ